MNGLTASSKMPKRLNVAHIGGRVIVLLWCLLGGVHVLHAGLFEKTHEQINAGNYSQALPLLMKLTDKQPNDFAVSYLWAVYYANTDNAAQHTDSAYYYISRSFRQYYKGTSGNDKRSYAFAGIRPYTMQALKQDIHQLAFETADSIGTVESWEHFISYYTDAPQKDLAIERRNQRAYKMAIGIATFESFKDFMDKYPNASQIPEAKKLYESLLYKDLTKDGTWQAYKKFIDKYPDSPYVEEAQEKYDVLLYADMTKDGRAVSYANFVAIYPNSPFVKEAERKVYDLLAPQRNVSGLIQLIRRYPDNPYVPEAWDILYDKLNVSRNAKELTRFIEDFPDYPDKRKLKRDLRLSKKELEMVESANGEVFGYIDVATGDTALAAIYYDAFDFSEGLAAVAFKPCDDNCMYGYIDKEGYIAIQAQFTEAGAFNNGLALVAMGNCLEDKCRWGFINRRGEAVIGVKYEEAFPFSEGLALCRLNGLYGFVDKNGNTIIPFRFEDAQDFSYGMAAVELNGLWGFINGQGKLVIGYGFTGAGEFVEGMAPVADADGKWGYIDAKGQWLIEPRFSFANAFEDGKAKVLVKTNNQGFMVDTEKVIDKTGNFIED